MRRLNFIILSTGGTAQVLRKNKIPVVEVAELTGFPEILGGRVKTLHPKIFGGILARNSKTDALDLRKNGIAKIDLVCVNLYPFAATIAKHGIKDAAAVEQIDIGGVSLLRAAAKNFSRVVVVADPRDYSAVVQKLTSGQLDVGERKKLAAAAFTQTARYDGLIAGFLGGTESFAPIYEFARHLRYGENPHQAATLFRDPAASGSNVANAKVLAGKELSFNNLVDADFALRLVSDFVPPTAAIIKHANPCGVASAKTIAEALKRAIAVDKKSPFGGVIAVNQPFSVAAALLVEKIFLEVIVAPSFAAGAQKVLRRKKNLRLLAVGKIEIDLREVNLKKIGGGLLVQNEDTRVVTAADLKVVTKKSPTAAQVRDLVFAANVCKHAKSNAIVLAKDGTTTGIGAGQTARVDAVEIAIAKAGTRASGSVLASDAFFPFPDAVEVAARAGVSAIVQSGGSIRDSEVIKAADLANVAMVFSSVRAFRH